MSSNPRESGDGCPIGDFPSPPPCGWSTGFIAVPLTEVFYQAILFFQPYQRKHFMIQVANASNGGFALHINESDFAAGQTYMSIIALFSH